MASIFRKFTEGLRIVPKTTLTSLEVEKGDLQVSNADGKLYYNNGSNSSSAGSAIVTESYSATLTNKTLDSVVILNQLDAATYKIVNLGTPTNAQDAVTKQYVDTAISASGSIITAWSSGQLYILNQLVLENNILYRCTTSHTSAVSFTTDLNAGKWLGVTTAVVAALNEIVVGTVNQVTAGAATHSSIQTAINSAVAGQRISLLRGTFTEALTIDREVHIYGQGRGSEIVGTITVSATGSNASIKNCRLNGNTTISGSAKNVVVSDNWIAPTYTVSGGNNAFIFNLGEIV